MAVTASNPIGNSIYAPLFLRVPLGAYFVLAGLTKIDNIDAFVQQVKAFGILSNSVATAFGGILPYVEILCGLMVIFGFLTTLASGVLSLLLVTFIYAIGLFPYAKVAFAENLFNKDLLLLAIAVSLLYSGPGAFSIDRFRRGG